MPFWMPWYRKGKKKNKEKAEMQIMCFLCDIKENHAGLKGKSNISFTFYALSRFKYCLLLVRNSIANRNFPG